MGQWIHRLSGIKPDQSLGNCDACGPVDLYWQPGLQRWQCRNKRRERKRLDGIKKKERTGWKPKDRGAEYKPYRKYKKSTCEKCGFVPEQPCQLDVDHIDGDHNNNEITNLQTLCANQAEDLETKNGTALLGAVPLFLSLHHPQQLEDNSQEGHPSPADHDHQDRDTEACGHLLIRGKH